MGYID